MDFLTERGARLFLRPAAPEQLGETAAQSGARRGQRGDGEQAARFASDGKDVLTGVRPRLHLADQPEAQQGGGRGPGGRCIRQ